jgi:CubicO group peptidase (beta-lactamase class C family)
MTAGRTALQDVVDEFAAAFARQHGLAGLAVGIVRDGQLVHTIDIGHASIERQLPVTPQSVFRVGSISKTFTAIAVMQLVDGGRVDLDRPVNEYLRHYRVDGPPQAEPVTLRHLLTHTAGIGELRRYTDVFQPFIGMAVPPGQAMPSFAEYYAPSLRAEVPPGQKWAYANHGFTTIGAVIEDVTGERFADYVRREILDPLGMTGSDFVRNERVADELCDGYARKRDRNKPVRYLDIIPSPAGSLFSSVSDLARYVAALANGGAPILGAARLDEMMRPHFRIDPRLAAMGLAFFLSDVDGHRVAGHDGGVPGFVSYLRVAPDDGVAVVVLTNSNNMKISMAIDRFGDELLRNALATRGGPRVSAAVAESRDVWPELRGSYGLRPGLNTNLRPWMMLGGEVEVFEAGDHLALRCFAGPVRAPARLRPVDENDPRRFTGDLGPMSIDVVFGDGAVHLGPPLNVSLFRRDYSFRERARAAAMLAGGVALLAVIRRRRRRARPS